MADSFPYDREDRNSRIILLDVLRAMALLGIVLAHAHDHFNCYIYPETGSALACGLNSLANWVNETFLNGKAFILFAFLFGLSFFIQLDRAEARGVDFRLRFSWRITLLFLIGLAHTLFYDGDILTIFAVQGLLLIPLYKVRSSWLLILAFFCILCLPALTVWLKHLNETPYLFDYQWENQGGERNDVFFRGTFLQVAEWNVLYGQTSKWKYIVESGRIGQTFGFFVLGLWAGKKRLFEHPETGRALFRAILPVSLPLWLLAHLLLSSGITGKWGTILGVASNLCFVMTLVAAVTILSRHNRFKSIVRWMAPVGKMTLSSYVAQSIFFCFFFYGWGLGMAPHIGYFASMAAAAAFFLLQSMAASRWLGRYAYGPLEWLWRSGTYRSWQSLRKKR